MRQSVAAPGVAVSALVRQYFPAEWLIADSVGRRSFSQGRRAAALSPGHRAAEHFRRLAGPGGGPATRRDPPDPGPPPDALPSRAALARSRAAPRVSHSARGPARRFVLRGLLPAWGAAEAARGQRCSSAAAGQGESQAEGCGAAAVSRTGSQVVSRGWVGVAAAAWLTQAVASSPQSRIPSHCESHTGDSKAGLCWLLVEIGVEIAAQLEGADWALMGQMFQREL